MRLRTQSSGKIYYYYDVGGKWAEFERDAAPHPSGIVTFRYVAERYMRDVLVPKASSTQEVEMFAMAKLLQFFDDPSTALGKIKPIHISRYLDWRIRDARERW